MGPGPARHNAHHRVLEDQVAELLMAVSFALSTGVLLLFLGLFLDYLHERREEQKGRGITT
jgi:hypothetical protein